MSLSNGVSPGARAAHQHNMGDEIHSTEMIHQINCSALTGNVDKYRAREYALGRPVEGWVLPHKVSNGLSVAQRLDQQRNTHTHTEELPSKAHTTYSHKCEHRHNRCGHDQLGGQDQIHLKEDGER